MNPTLMPNHFHRQTSPHAHLWPGVPLALGSAVLFGVWTPFSKLLLGSLDPQLLAGLLYLGAGCGLGLIHFGRPLLGIASSEAPLRRADFPWLAAIVLFGGVIGPLFLMLGLARSAATTASLLLNLEGLATMSIAWIFFREFVDRRLLLGALAILAGAAALSWTGGGLPAELGAAYIAAACVAWGIDNNLTRKLSASDPVALVMTKGLTAGSTNGALALLNGASLPQAPILLEGALLGFLSVGVSLVLFVLALRHLGTARTGAYFSLAPFIGAMVAIVILHDTVTLQLLLAAGLMGLGLSLHLTERHEHDHLHEALEHDHAHTHDEHHRHHHDRPVSAPHTHWHRHGPMRHRHIHYPDLHHRHPHR